MRLAIVKTDIAPLAEQPGHNQPLADEVLSGMVVELLEPAGCRRDDGGRWCRVRTHDRFEGYVEAACLHPDDAAAAQWRAVGRQVVRSPYLDVMAAPDAGSPRVAGLPRGGLLRPLAPAGSNGWLPVALGDGRRGYARHGNLMPHLTEHSGETEKRREALAMTAMSYLGAQYRRGGRTPQGIDAGGLVAMAYLLNGWVIGREPRLCESFGLAPVGRDAVRMGDILYFHNHCALYLGDGKYLHATGSPGSDGVVINSLEPASPFYRADLAETVTACATVFAGA